MLRNAVQGDIPALARIYTAALQETYRDILPESYLASLTVVEGEDTWRRILAQPGREVLVEECGGAGCGFASCKPDDAHAGWLMLASLYVDGQSQGRGIGKRLIHAVWDRARAMGFENVSVSVVRDNPRARGMYERMGAVYLNDSVYSFGPYPVVCRNYVWPLASVLPSDG